MSKLSLVVSQERVLNFSEEEKFLSISSARKPSLDFASKPINLHACSVDELLFTLQNSLVQLKTAQSQVSFLADELLTLTKKY
ncbi:MAG: hypothetical protein HAW63_01460 [Bdellovibrionaceae bacterium]|nr:hypothetical protein [Pseudobdellovibrionaceae bacterium]